MTRTLCLILSACLLLSNPAICLAETMPAPQAIIEEGAQVRLKLEEALSTKTASEGQKLQLVAAEDVLGKDGKTVVIKEGAPAIGYLINVDEKSCARGGKLSIDIRSVKAIDGSRIQLHAVKTNTGGNGAGAGSYILGGLVLGWLGLGIVALAGQSKHAKIPEGTVITAFVEHDNTIAVAPSTSVQTANKSDAVTTVSANVVSTNKPDSQATNSPDTSQNKESSSAKIDTEKPVNSKTVSSNMLSQ